MNEVEALLPGNTTPIAEMLYSVEGSRPNFEWITGNRQARRNDQPRCGEPSEENHRGTVDWAPGHAGSNGNRSVAPAAGKIHPSGAVLFCRQKELHRGDPHRIRNRYIRCRGPGRRAGSLAPDWFFAGLCAHARSSPPSGWALPRRDGADASTLLRQEDRGPSGLQVGP